MGGSGHVADDEGRARFVREHARPSAVSLVPELTLFTATAVTPLWHATEAWLSARGVPPPFWAFAWCGGQAIARYLLDTPSVVAGKRVLDVACGGGVVAIAAAKAGAAHVHAVDIDPFAIAAATLNAELNGVALEATCSDAFQASETAYDVVTAGDVCYERPMADLALAWLRAHAARGARVLVGDPDRTYAPTEGVRALARFDVSTPHDLEGTVQRTTHVWEICSPR